MNYRRHRSVAPFRKSSVNVTRIQRAVGLLAFLAVVAAVVFLKVMPSRRTLTASIGESVRVGSFDLFFEAAAVRMIDRASPGPDDPSGPFLVVRLVVKNNGESPRLIDVSYQAFDVNGRELPLPAGRGDLLGDDNGRLAIDYGESGIVLAVIDCPYDEREFVTLIGDIRVDNDRIPWSVRVPFRAAEIGGSS